MRRREENEEDDVEDVDEERRPTNLISATKWPREPHFGQFDRCLSRFGRIAVIYAYFFSAFFLCDDEGVFIGDLAGDA